LARNGRNPPPPTRRTPACKFITGSSREYCDYLPASVAEDNCAFPIAVDTQRLTLLLPDDVDEDTTLLLEFILNRPLEIVLAPRERVARLFRIAYGKRTGERQVASCGGKFRARCTLDWNDLLPTSQSNVRFCADCSRPVYYCGDDEELRLRSAAGQCAAIDLLRIEESDGGVTMGLTEFVDPE
jgi:hypothetical protein